MTSRPVLFTRPFWLQWNREVALFTRLFPQKSDVDTCKPFYLHQNQVLRYFEILHDAYGTSTCLILWPMGLYWGNSVRLSNLYILLYMMTLCLNFTLRLHCNFAVCTVPSNCCSVLLKFNGSSHFLKKLILSCVAYLAKILILKSWELLIFEVWMF